MSRKFFSLVFFFMLGFFPPVLEAAIYPFEIFTNNSSYDYGPDLDLYVDVSDGLGNQVDFTFYNESVVNCAIASIYFDDDSLLSVVGISNGPGTVFSQFAKPGNLPAGKTLNPSFVTAGGLSFDSEPAPPKNGINPDEWLKITFDVEGGSFGDLLGYLGGGDIRMGLHIIALPNGSSESAINIPEPAAFCLVVVGAFSVFRRSRRRTR